MTHRSSKKEVEAPEIGEFHILPCELQDSLMVMGKRKASLTRRKFQSAVHRQALARQEKKDTTRKKKVDGAKDGLVPASYLHQQYDLPRCWKSEKKHLIFSTSLLPKKLGWKVLKSRY